MRLIAVSDVADRVLNVLAALAGGGDAAPGRHEPDTVQVAPGEPAVGFDRDVAPARAAEVLEIRHERVVVRDHQYTPAVLRPWVSEVLCAQHGHGGLARTRRTEDNLMPGPRKENNI